LIFFRFYFFKKKYIGGEDAEFYFFYIAF